MGDLATTGNMWNRMVGHKPPPNPAPPVQAPQSAASGSAGNVGNDPSSSHSTSQHPNITSRQNHAGSASFLHRAAMAELSKDQAQGFQEACKELIGALVLMSVAAQVGTGGAAKRATLAAQLLTWSEQATPGKTAEFTVDPETLKELGVSPGQPVSLDLLAKLAKGGGIAAAPIERALTTASAGVNAEKAKAFQGACAALEQVMQYQLEANPGSAAKPKPSAVMQQLSEWANMPTPAKPEDFAVSPEMLKKMGLSSGQAPSLDLLKQMAKAGDIPRELVDTALNEARAIEQATDERPPKKNGLMHKLGIQHAKVPQIELPPSTSGSAPTPPPIPTHTPPAPPPPPGSIEHLPGEQARGFQDACQELYAAIDTMPTPVGPTMTTSTQVKLQLRQWIEMDTPAHPEGFGVNPGVSTAIGTPEGRPVQLDLLRKMGKAAGLPPAKVDGALLGARAGIAQENAAAFKDACAALCELIPVSEASVGTADASAHGKAIEQLNEWRNQDTPAKMEKFAVKPELLKELGLPPDQPATLDLLKRIANAIGVERAPARQALANAEKVARDSAEWLPNQIGDTSEQDKLHQPDGGAKHKDSMWTSFRNGVKNRYPQVETEVVGKGRTRVGTAFSAVIDAKTPTAAQLVPKPVPTHGPIGEHLSSVPRSDAARERVLKANRGAARMEVLEIAAAKARTELLKTIASEEALVLPNLEEALGGPEPFERILTEKLGASDETEAFINDMLEGLEQPEDPAQQPELKQRLLLAQALMSPGVLDPATGTANDVKGKDAQDALQYLKSEMNFNGLTGAAPSDNPAAVLAWQAAEVLARSDEGFALLLNNMHVAPEPHERENFRTFLQAAGKLRAQPKMEKFEGLPPHSLLESASSLGNSAASRALQASGELLKQTATPSIGEATTNRAAFTRTVNKALGESPATTLLMSEILEGEPDLAKALMLANALTPASVLDGKPPTAATGLAALDTFYQLASKTSCEDLARPHNVENGEPDVAARALQCAEVLSRTTLGFETLIARMAVPPPKEQEADMRAFLQAADALRQSTPSAVGDPHTMLAQARSDQLDNTLATRVLKASADRLTGIPPRDEAAAANEVGDLLAWRQGAREDGPGSTQKLLTARLHKFTNLAVPRAENTGLAKDFNNTLGLKNTPLNSLSMGAQGTHFAGIPAELGRYSAAFQKACVELGRIAPSLPPPVGNRAQAERAVVTDLFKHWAQMTPAPKQPEDFKLDKLAAAPLGSPLLDLVGKPVTLDLLADLASSIQVSDETLKATLKDARAMEQAADLVPASMTRENMDKMFDKLIGDMQANSRLKLNDGAITGLSTVGASKMLSTVTENTLLVGVRADARYDFGRHATLEIGRTAQGYEIFMGTTKTHRVQGGVGVKLGVNLGIEDKGEGLEAKARVGGGVTVTPVDYENSQARGLIFRVGRTLNEASVGKSDETWATVSYDEPKMVKTTQNLMKFLLNADNAGISEKELWNKLADEFGEDVSIGWQENKVTTNRQKLAIDFGVGISGKVGKNHSARIGISANVTGENNAGQFTKVKETGGTDNLASRKVGTSMTLSAGATVGMGASSKKAEGGVSSGGLDLLSVQANLVEQNQSVKLSMPTVDGKLMNRSTYIDTEFTDVDAYIEKIEQDRTQWEKTLIVGDVRARFKAEGVVLSDAQMEALMRNSPEEGGLSAEDIKLGKEKLDLMIATARLEDRPNFKYLVRQRITPEAAKQYDRLAALDKQAGKTFGAGDYKEQQRLLLANPANWLPQKLASSEKIVEKDSTGLKAGARVIGMKQAEGARELRGFNYN